MSENQIVGVAFFKAASGEIDDKVIDKVTGGLGFSHVELMVSDTETIGSHYLAKGVKKFTYGKPLDMDDRWVVINVPVSDAASVIEYAKNQIGKSYDAFGVVVTALTPFKCDCKNSVWCSELVAKALMVDENHKSVDPLAMPNDLFEYLFIEKGYHPHRKVSTDDYSEKECLEIDRFGRIKIEG